jgi:hypothetical protein
MTYIGNTSPHDIDLAPALKKELCQGIPSTFSMTVCREWSSLQTRDLRLNVGGARLPAAIVSRRRRKWLVRLILPETSSLKEQKNFAIKCRDNAGELNQ